MERIEAELLIPGRGQPLRDGAALLEVQTIAYAGAAAQTPPTASGEARVQVAVAMPRLWDCHGHLLLGLPFLEHDPLGHRSAAGTQYPAAPTTCGRRWSDLGPRAGSPGRASCSGRQRGLPKVPAIYRASDPGNDREAC
jgi:hypothetical protein